MLRLIDEMREIARRHLVPEFLHGADDRPRLVQVAGESPGSPLVAVRRVKLLEPAMPVSFLVDAEHRVIFLRLSGVVTEEELLATGRAANNDERAKGGFDRLINLAEVTELKISSAGVRRVADVARRYVVGRRALVATSPITFGIARMWEQNLLLPEEASRVFDNLPDAMEFLGLPRETPWPAGSA